MATTPRSFDTSKITFGELIAGASGLALIIFMFLPWFEIGTSDEEGQEQLDEAGDALDLTYSAWEAFQIWDIVLVLIGLTAIAYLVARALDAVPVLPIPPGLIVAVLGALAVVIILFKIIVTPNVEFEFGGESVKVKDEEDGEVNRKIFGLLLGLISAAGIAFGGWMASQERGAGGGAAVRATGGAVGAGPGALGGQPPAEPTQAAGQPAAGQPAADWYPDPKGEARLRYWDGAQWTDQTAD